MSRPYADADVFRAVADPTRRRVLELLRNREQSQGELAAHFDCSLPTLSFHLRMLRSAGLVTQHRAGRRRLYALRKDVLTPIARFAESFSQDRQPSHARTSP